MVEEKSYSIPCFASLGCKQNRGWYSTFPVNISFLFIWPCIESKAYEKVKSEYASPISNAYVSKQLLEIVWYSTFLLMMKQYTTKLTTFKAYNSQPFNNTTRNW